jgi:ABC-type thiamine transport system ATPase subunit
MHPHWNIQLDEPHSGELGEAIEHEDHSLVASEYHYEAGAVLEVVVHHVEDPKRHIFTDLDSGHRFKIPAAKYHRV